MRIIIFFILIFDILLSNEGLNYLNYLRSQAGMTFLKSNELLDKAAFNHSKYLFYNKVFSHYEEPGKPYFTGIRPADRSVYVGYKSKKIFENISYGEKSYKEAIDGLFSAIYHRLGFLNEIIDEVGMGRYNSIYTFDMGNSYLNQLCASKINFTFGSYYSNLCANKDFFIPLTDYNNACNKVALNNPKIILWPPKDYKKADVVFYDEFPDPLPDREVSGYPISVKFNRFKVQSVPKMLSFKLFLGDKEIESRVLDYSNDPNKKLSKYEFVLFPMERLDFNTEYRAIFVYEEDGEKKRIEWNFKTKTLPYPMLKDDSVFKVKSGKIYAVYMKPEDGKNISFEGCSYDSRIELFLDYFDKNTLLIKLKGMPNREAICSFSNGKKIKFIISN